MNEFTLEWARHHEAKRRRNMLGAELARECTYDILRERSRITGIPIVILSEWRKSYEASGDEGLYPQSWTELANDVKPIVWERYKLLGDLADAEEFTDEQITAHAARVGWTVRQTQRWLLRYRIGGLWGLAPGHDHEKHRRRGRWRHEQPRSTSVPAHYGIGCAHTANMASLDSHHNSAPIKIGATTSVIGWLALSEEFASQN